MGTCIIFAAMGGFVLLLRHDVRRLETSLNAVETELAQARAQAKADAVLLDFELQLPGRGELFPAMTGAPGTDAAPLARLEITNGAATPVAQFIEAEIPGWSRPVKQREIVGPRETREVTLQPPLLPSAFKNEEIRRERLEVSVTGVDGNTLFADSRPILLHGGSDLLWGDKLKNVQVAARWVTPHDPAVLDLVSRARRHAPRGRLAGYGSGKADPAAVRRHVRQQAEAVFDAMSESGISYVNSLFVMGEYLDRAQRVRLPRETLALKSANCMDVSVAFASAMENLGLQPLLVIVPGHAYAGVRLDRSGDDVLYLDLTVLPDGSFARAEARARAWQAKTPPERVRVVDVAAARSLGLYPLVAEASPAS
ncbi:MAG TPA: hypothetical protein VFV75_05390 [Candidatus Polarisedimenticolaceae bacterium]|nr:hypothetical protein [Candidatus Polarisedimenticolaceae bacterium]